MSPLHEAHRFLRAVFYSPFLVHAIRSISRVLSSTAIYLDPGCSWVPATSWGRPGQPVVPHTVLLRIEFTAPPMFPWGGCALTTPFHPYLAGTSQGAHTPNEAVSFCCTCPRVTPGGRYPLSLPCGARTFRHGGPFGLPPRLSDLVAGPLYRISEELSKFFSDSHVWEAPPPVRKREMPLP